MEAAPCGCRKSEIPARAAGTGDARSNPGTRVHRGRSAPGCAPAKSLIGINACRIPSRAASYARDLGERHAASQRQGAQHVHREVAIAEPEPASPPSSASADMKFHVSFARPQPATGLLTPASVYMTVSRSGEIAKPEMLEVIAGVDDERQTLRRQHRRQTHGQARAPDPACKRDDHRNRSSARGRINSATGAGAPRIREIRAQAPPDTLRPTAP